MERFGWTEQEYNSTSRQTIAEFSLILRTLDEMAQDETKNADKEKRKWPSK
jgi:hypothetical protein